VTATLAHTHPLEYEAVAMCPACRASGAVNPDTGTPWPSLSDADVARIDEELGRLTGRPAVGHAELREALARAYQRGAMQGRLSSRASLERQADSQEQTARDAALRALERLTAAEPLETVLPDLRDATRWAARASTVRRAAHHPA
jgi:hypothetical protein